MLNLCLSWELLQGFMLYPLEFLGLSLHRLGWELAQTVYVPSRLDQGQSISSCPFTSTWHSNGVWKKWTLEGNVDVFVFLVLGMESTLTEIHWQPSKLFPKDIWVLL